MTVQSPEVSTWVATCPICQQRQKAIGVMTEAIGDVGPDQPLERYAEAALDALLPLIQDRPAILAKVAH